MRETMNETITYFFPGMAASDVMFYKYRNLPFKCHFFNWIDPIKNERVKDYAARYIQMMDRSKKINLVGVSFGGILAVEIAGQIEVNKVVLISSMTSRKTYPFLMKLFKHVPLYRLIPPKMPPINKGIVRKIFGIERKEDLEFFIKMISRYNFKNLRWSIRELLHWEYKEEMQGLIHIIGDQDRLFKPANTTNEIIIPGGTHYMVVDRAEDVKNVLIEVLGNGNSIHKKVQSDITSVS